jgi:hypothetical protein
MKTQKVAKDVLTVPTKDHITHLVMIKIFQNKLEKAVAEGKLKI